MASIISASINLSKIDKSKIVEGKNGAKYYNFDVIVNNDFDQYNNNVQLCDKQTKEQRTAKEKKNYLGNGRVIWSDVGKAETQDQEPKQEWSADPNADNDLPF